MRGAAMSIKRAIMVLYFTLDIWNFFSDRAVPATNILVCNKIHLYTIMGSCLCTQGL